MPELPEVETVRRGLAGLLPGRIIHSVSSDFAKSFPNPVELADQFMVGASVTDIRRRAKVLIIELSSGYSLVIHLKMTGQLVFRSDNERFGAGHPNDSLIGDLPDKSTRVIIVFNDGSSLYFNDQRKFGWMKLLPTLEIPAIDFFKKVGPEPLEPGFTWRLLSDRLSRRQNSVIKAALLDQTVIAGIGNIYADESLWGARIHPASLVRNVRDTEVRKLCKSLQSILLLSIEKGGSTDRNYVDAQGHRGSYLSFAQVFRREGQPCPRHPDTLILKTRVAGRGTHYCPKCQYIARPAR